MGYFSEVNIQMQAGRTLSQAMKDVEDMRGTKTRLPQWSVNGTPTDSMLEAIDLYHQTGHLILDLGILQYFKPEPGDRWLVKAF